MRYAFIADIHGHVDVLHRVLDAIRREPVDQIVSLGDAGADAACDLLRAAGAIGVFGNWEVSGFDRLSAPNREWVLGLPPVLAGDGFVAAHAVPTYPVGLFDVRDFQEYIRRTGASWRSLFRYPTDEDESLWEIDVELAARGRPVFFHGHNHRQQVWRLDPPDRPRLLSPRPAVVRLDLESRYVVCPGALSRPVDDGPGYALFDSTRLELDLRRV